MQKFSQKSAAFDRQYLSDQPSAYTWRGRHVPEGGPGHEGILFDGLNQGGCGRGKHLVALRKSYREGATIWGGFLKDSRARGLKQPAV